MVVGSIIEGFLYFTFFNLMWANSKYCKPSLGISVTVPDTRYLCSTWRMQHVAYATVLHATKIDFSDCNQWKYIEWKPVGLTLFPLITSLKLSRSSPLLSEQLLRAGDQYAIRGTDGVRFRYLDSLIFHEDVGDAVVHAALTPHSITPSRTGPVVIGTQRQGRMMLGNTIVFEPHFFPSLRSNLKEV